MAISLVHILTPGCKRYVMQQYLTYLCTDINETGPSLVVFLRVDQLYVLRFLFCRVYIYLNALNNLSIIRIQLNRLLEWPSAGKLYFDENIFFLLSSNPNIAHPLFMYVLSFNCMFISFF